MPARRRLHVIGMTPVRAMGGFVAIRRRMLS